MSYLKRAVRSTVEFAPIVFLAVVISILGVASALHGQDAYAEASEVSVSSEKTVSDVLDPTIVSGIGDKVCTVANQAIEEIEQKQAEAEEQARLEAEEQARLEAEEQARQAAAAKKAQQQSYSYSQGSSGQLTKSGGVNYYNGRKETWYSSNVLHHYRTSEWTLGSDGIYRDSDGYVVVAASDLAHGSTVATSHGEGKVYDSGCAAGTTDIYTAW